MYELNDNLCVKYSIIYCNKKIDMVHLNQVRDKRQISNKKIE